jgi:drug/metabolite transporter (DMT)-like permease
MNRISPFVRGMAIIAAVAAVIVVLDAETALVTAGFLLSVAFYFAIAFVAYLLWRDFGRREISMWPPRQQRVFYGAVALFVIDAGWYFTAKFTTSLTGPDLLAFFLVAAACVYAAVRTWRDQKRYS